MTARVLMRIKWIRFKKSIVLRGSDVTKKSFLAVVLEQLTMDCAERMDAIAVV